MFDMSAVIAIVMYASAGWALPAAPMSWNEADALCKKKQGAGCCAVAGDDGFPKMTGGALHCSCAARALGARLTIADRKQLAKDTTNIKMTPVPAPLQKATKRGSPGT